MKEKEDRGSLDLTRQVEELQDRVKELDKSLSIGEKKITEKQMKQLQILSKESGQGIVSIILDKNFATETDIAETIAKSYDLPKIKFYRFIQPGQPITIDISFNENKNNWSFNIYNRTEKFTSGRVTAN